jgi:hypothetical protein
MSDRSHTAVWRPTLEHQRLLHFTLGLGVWGFALVSGLGMLTPAMPLSALLIAAAAGAVLTTVGVADHRDRPLLNIGDFAMVDALLALVLTVLGIGYLFADQGAAALMFCAPAAAIGLGASVVRYA